MKQSAEIVAVADHLRMTVPALSAAIAERLAEGLRPLLAEVWEDGAATRASADPATTVRGLNPYRTPEESLERLRRLLTDDHKEARCG